jgi:segregation and condensation protein A
LPRAAQPGDGLEEDPRAELVRRLQEYERFKRAAEGIDNVPRLERDHWVANAEFTDRSVARLLPEVTLKEMLLAFKDVALRSEMFAHHHVQRERLSVRARMSDILTTLDQERFVEFTSLFRPEEGRMGVAVTFIAILELVREGLIEIVQNEAYAPLHVRAGNPARAGYLLDAEDVSAQAQAEAAAALASVPLDDEPEDADDADASEIEE